MNKGKDSAVSVSDTILIYNQYNEKYNPSDFKEWATKIDPELSSVPQYAFSAVFGSIAHRKIQGKAISEDQETWFANKVSVLKASIEKTDDNQENTETRQRIIHDLSKDSMAEIDDLIDNNGEGGLKPIDICKKLSLSKRDMKKVRDYLIRIKTEFEELVEEKTPDLVEAYSYMGGVRQWKKHLTMYKEWISDFDGQTSRTPRKVKIKKLSVRKMTEKVNVKMEDSEYGLVGVDPSKVLGKNTVWIFDTEYKELIYLKSSKGFTIRGTTIYDIDSGEKKKLRKPNEILPLLAGSKVCDRVFAEVKTKSQSANGRLHDKKIILKVF